MTKKRKPRRRKSYGIMKMKPPKIKEPTVQEKIGVIVMLDALGVKDFGMKECRQFLQAKDYIRQMIGYYYQQEAANHAGTIKQSAARGELVPKGEPEVISFGDTIIVCWEGEKQDTPSSNGTRPVQSGKEALNDEFNGAFFTVLIAPVISKVVTECLKLDPPVPLRGAISFGPYIQESNIVLGKAVADAARWCERARWIGVVVTPSLGARLTWWQETTEHSTGGFWEQMPAYFVEYPVPLRNGPPQHLWSLSWPCLPLGWDKEYTMSMKQLFFCLAIAQLGVPDAAARIYTNTVDYITWFRTTYSEKPKGVGE